MSFGGHLSSATVNVASGASTSSDVILGARTAVRGFVRIGSMSTAVNVAIQGSDDGGSTYYFLYHPSIASTTVGTPQYFISSTVGNVGGLVPIPVAGIQRFRFVCTGVVSGGVSFKVQISD